MILTAKAREILMGLKMWNKKTFESNFDPAIPAEHPPDSGKNVRKKVAKKQQQNETTMA